MKKPERILQVAFADVSLKNAFEELKKGKYEEQQLVTFLERAISDLKKKLFLWNKNPFKTLA